MRYFASLFDITDRVRRQRGLEEEVERRRRTEATLRDALAQDQEGLRFRDFLIREVNHRTKNALQLAVSLLRVQASRATPETRGALDAAAQRLRRIGEVHSLLTRRGEAPDAVDFPPPPPVPADAEDMVAEPGRVAVEVEADEATWGPDLVVPLGLIAGEALTNALKHAFPQGRGGRVRLVLRAAA